MKFRIVSFVTGLLLISIAVSAYNFWQVPAVAKITFPLGSVMVLPKGEKKMQKAGFNQDLFPGDKVRTEKQARCEIKYNDGSIVRIDQQSIYTIEKADIKKDKKEVESKIQEINLKSELDSLDKEQIRSRIADIYGR